MPIAHWHEQIGDPSIADSILDRLVHNAYRIELNGESMRKKRGRKPEARLLNDPFRLKQSTGWFAAGREVELAAPAFRCRFQALSLVVPARRSWPRHHPASPAALAIAMHKTEDDIRTCLRELVQSGVCHCGPANLIVIRDSFWPYTRTSVSICAPEAERYVAEVRRIFLSQRCVSSAFTPADDRIAADWHRSGVPLECVERAILLGCLRKYVTFINHGSGTPITTLGYFRSLIDEIDQLNASPDYWQYVAIRLTALERRWSRQHDRPSRGRDPEKTK